MKMIENDEINLKKIRKILVIGSYAKEHITVENIKEHHPDIEVFVFSGMKNPGIMMRIINHRSISACRINLLL